MSELAKANAHIPTSEIEQDIVDTEREIAQMELEALHFEQTPYSLPEARLNHMKASVRRTGIKERQEFIAKLKEILNERAQGEREPAAGEERK